MRHYASITPETEHTFIEHLGKANLMMMLTIPNYAKKLLSRENLGFLYDNVLKMYAQLIRLNPEKTDPPLINVLNKLTLDQQMDFLSYLDDDPIKHQIREMYLKAHPEIDQLKAKEKEITTACESLTKRTAALTELCKRIPDASIDISQLTNRILKCIQEINQFGRQVSQLGRTAKAFSCWRNSNESLDFKNHLDQLSTLSEQLIQHSKELKKFKLPSKGSWQENEGIIANTSQYKVKLHTIRDTLLALPGKEAASDNKYDLDIAYSFFYKDFKDEPMKEPIAEAELNNYKEMLRQHIQSKLQKFNCSTLQDFIALCQRLESSEPIHQQRKRALSLSSIMSKPKKHRRIERPSTQ
jgi:hypothetical protein